MRLMVSAQSTPLVVVGVVIAVHHVCLALNVAEQVSHILSRVCSQLNIKSRVN